MNNFMQNLCTFIKVFLSTFNEVVECFQRFIESRRRLRFIYPLKRLLVSDVDHPLFTFFVKLKRKNKEEKGNCLFINP